MFCFLQNIFERPTLITFDSKFNEFCKIFIKFDLDSMVSCTYK